MTKLPDFDHLDAFAQTLAAAAAQISLPLFRTLSLGTDNKLDKGFDPVTEADKGSERAIRALISEHFPDHGVIGEEYGEHQADAEFVWVLDPIDGTRAFISGLPLWTTLIGLRHHNRPVVGVIAQPFLGEIFIGSPNLGSRLITTSGETPLKVRDCGTLSAATLGTTDPFLFKGPEADAFGSLRKAARLSRYGCDAYAFAMVAQGTMDIALETGLMAWDIDAIIPVIENAGGTVTDWFGNPVGEHGGQVIASGATSVRDEALSHLRPAAA